MLCCDCEIDAAQSAQDLDSAIRFAKMFDKILSALQIGASADQFVGVVCLFVDAPQRMRTVFGNATDRVFGLNYGIVHLHLTSLLQRTASARRSC